MHDTGLLAAWHRIDGGGAQLGESRKVPDVMCAHTHTRPKPDPVYIAELNEAVTEDSGCSIRKKTPRLQAYAILIQRGAASCFHPHLYPLPVYACEAHIAYSACQYVGKPHICLRLVTLRLLVGPCCRA